MMMLLHFRSSPKGDDLVKPDSMSVRPNLMKLCLWLEVDEWCTTVTFFQSQGQGHGVRELSNAIPPHTIKQPTDLAPRQIDRLRHGQRKRMELSYFEFFGLFRRRVEAEFPISFQGLDHGTPILGWLSKSAKCILLGHELSNVNETWCEWMSMSLRRCNLDSNWRSRSWSRDFEIHEMCPYAKWTGFDSVGGIDLRFQCYECSSGMGQWPWLVWHSHKQAHHFVGNPHPEVMNQLLIVRL